MLAKKSHLPSKLHEPDHPLLTDKSSRVTHLRPVVLFSDIKNEQGALEALAEMMELRIYNPNGTIITEGETGAEFFILIDGEAGVYKSTPENDMYKVAILKGSQHACFGEGGLLGTDSRSATIKAETICHCLVLNGTAFTAFGKVNPNWALLVVLRISRAIVDRMRSANNDLLLLYNALVAEIRGR
ncbi:MAG: cyclic nucleotide-binding domain-containing protein [Bdellovibrionota bacterium]